MNTNTTAAAAQLDAPLTKLQMLEEEFVALGGTLPTGHTAETDLAKRHDQLIALLHAKPRTALCISGGGIRSATFALGLVQGLATRKLLTEFDYLSTVSGGGYVGSWLSSWARRSPNGMADVSDALARPLPDQATKDPTTNGTHARVHRDDPCADPRPVAHLRQFSNYLTPKLGLLSADTWTLAATYVRNLVVNWLVFVPLLLCVLMIPRLCIPSTDYITSRGWIIFMLTLGVGLVITGLTVTGLSVPSVAFPKRSFLPDTPEGRNRQGWLGQGGFLRGVFIPLSAAATCLTIAWAWYRAPGTDFDRPIPPFWMFVVAGVATYLLTFLCTWLLGRRKSLDLNVRAYLRSSDLVIFPVVGALAGLLTYVEAVHIFPNPSQTPVAYTCLSAPLMLAIHFLAGTLYVAFKSRTSDPRDDEDREWWARTAGWLFVAIAAWSIFSAIVLIGPEFLMPKFWATIVPAGAASGLLTMFLSQSSSTPANKDREKSKSPKSLLSNAALVLAAPAFIAFLVAALSLLTDVILSKEIPLDQQSHRTVLTQTSLLGMILIVIGLLALGLFCARFINLNKFSMHALYRNRLIRGYLGASRQRNPNLFTGFDADDNLQMYNLRSRPVAGAPPLTDVNLADAPALLLKLRDQSNWLSARIWPLCGNCAALAIGAHDDRAITAAILADLNTLVVDGCTHANLAAAGYLCDPRTDSSKLSRGVLDRVAPPQGPTSSGDPTSIDRNRHLLEHVYAGHVLPGAQRPLHVVNIALNLVGGDQLAWQERKAESFTVSALHCGNHSLGYRRSLSYGGEDGISLGTAVAISGAAASPNSGYHSSPPLALLMTIFNVRLGWWLGNPRDAKSSRLSSPLFSVAPIVNEAFGLTNACSPYVYLSDGGHFENLGLYEMVHRRCRTIVLSDGGCDPSCIFEDLGNAIRKIRIDLGIEITIDTSKIFSRDNEHAAHGKYCAIGTIHYTRVDGPGPDGAKYHDGKLLYVKPSIAGGEPTDVHNYASVHKAFPHEPTGDQWFSESQFESYRALGEHVFGTIWGSDPLDSNSSGNTSTRVGELLRRAQRHIKQQPTSEDGRVHEFAAWAREYIDTHIARPSDRSATTHGTNPETAKDKKSAGG